MSKVKIKNSDQEFNVGKIVCVGRNYAEHARELGNEVPDFPIIFLKPASTIIYNNDEIIHPEYSSEMHHEVELVLLIGKKVKSANNDEAEIAISAYGIGLDMTLRDLQNQLKDKGQPWTLAKCFDTGAVVSDFISKSEYQLKGNEKIKLSVNGEIKQDSTLDKMIFSSVEIVKYISDKMALEEGDLIFTGTPAGVGKVSQGDIIEASLENIGTLKNKIV